MYSLKYLQIVGFSIPGRVLESAGGKPLSKARVVLNGVTVGVTDEDGIFVLEKIKAGTHKIYVEAGNARKELS